VKPADYLRLVTLAAIWGASFLFVRLSVGALGAQWLTEFRVGIAALAMLTYALLLGVRLEWRLHWRAYLVMGLGNSGLPWILYAWAGHHLSASMMAILNATTPFYGAVFAALWLGEPLDRRKLLGLAIGLAGVMLVVGLGPLAPTLDVLLGALACVSATLCYALSTTWLKRTRQTVGAIPLTTASLLVSTLVLAPFLPPLPPAQAFTPAVIGAVLGIALLCSAIAFLLYFRLLADVGPTRTLTVTFLIPVFGVLWGNLFLGEPLGLGTLAGGLMVLGAVALVTRR
jgi:drug/metabolite transporter (DMT)-like permease